MFIEEAIGFWDQLPHDSIMRIANTVSGIVLMIRQVNNDSGGNEGDIDGGSIGYLEEV